MRRKPIRLGGLVGGLVLAVSGTISAGPYQNLVFSLNPTYYYELNELTTAGGVRDSMGNAPNGTYNGDYSSANGPRVGVPGPLFVNETIPVPGLGGEINVAHASNNTGHINLGNSTLFGAQAMTVAMFAKAGPAQGGDRLFTNNLTDPTRSFQMVVGNDGLVVAVNPAATGINAERTLHLPDNSTFDRGLVNSSNGWYHIVASTQGANAAERAANIRVWVNGEDRTSNMLPTEWGWGVATSFAKIGGREATATHTTTHSGAQDEVAIWLNRVLTDDEAVALWFAAQAPAGPDCNLDGVAGCDTADLDLLQANIGTTNSQFDLDESGTVTVSDRDLWLESAGSRNIRRPYLVGDSNLDGDIDEADAGLLLGSLFQNRTAWSDGDFNVDGRVDGTDFNIWNRNRGQVAANAAVPEPTSAVLASFFAAILFAVRRRS